MFPKEWEGPILDESEFKQSNGKYPSATRRLQSWHGNKGHRKKTVQIRVKRGMSKREQESHRKET